MKIEVGMYVRNDTFGIGRINKDYFDSNNKHWFNVKFNCYKDEGCHCGICAETKGFKVSDNIIDLIEVGDYVNGCLVHFSPMVDDESTGYFIDKDYKRIWLNKNSQIKSVLTKEIFEANSYKVGE